MLAGEYDLMCYLGCFLQRSAPLLATWILLGINLLLRISKKINVCTKRMNKNEQKGN